MNTILKLTDFSLDLTPLFGILPDEDVIVKADAAFRTRLASGQFGFYDLPKKLSENEPECVLAAAKKIRAEYDGALVLGIGGSYLGGASAVDAVGSKDFPLVWVSNIDPKAIRDAAAVMKGRKMATVIISKSGNTTETLAALYHFGASLDTKGFITITDPISGELRRLSKDGGWAAMEVPQNIGGRFSVLTPVGLLPAALGGVDLPGLIRGAARTREAFEKCAPLDHPAYLLAASLYQWDKKGHGLHYLMPYWSAMRLFAEWYVQLWGESLGKLDSKKHPAGPTAVAALGTTDQHSLLQVFKEGPRNKVIGFMDILGIGDELKVGTPPFAPGENAHLCRHSFEKISHEALVATQQSLTHSSVPTYRITAPKLNAEAVGALYFFFEVATAFAGELYGVNPFDQPGVEESKRLLHAALR